MNQLDQSVQVFRRHLSLTVSHNLYTARSANTYSIILLVKVIDVTVQDLDEQLDRDRGVHASISHTQGSLQTLEHSLAVSVELLVG